MMEEKKMCSLPCCTGRNYTFFGVLAVVYGVINYMTDVMFWQPYMAWVIGGVILLLIAWTKGSTKC